MVKLERILETALYVDDLEKAAQFYSDVLQLEIMTKDERLCALNVNDLNILLLFDRKVSKDPIKTAGGVIPGHTGSGPLHMAFAITAADLQGWEQRLKEKNIEIISEVTWPRGGKSIYFNDPSGHVIELSTPGVWPNY